MAVERHKIDVEGLSTSYLVSGEGPPLLLLHAVEESAFDWRWVLPELSRHYRVYAPDLPDFGESAKPTTADYTPAFFECFVAAYLDALGIERAAVARGRKRGSSASARGRVGPGRTVACRLRLQDQGRQDRRDRRACRPTRLRRLDLVFLED